MAGKQAHTVCVYSIDLMCESSLVDRVKTVAVWSSSPDGYVSNGGVRINARKHRMYRTRVGLKIHAV